MKKPLNEEMKKQLNKKNKKNKIFKLHKYQFKEIEKRLNKKLESYITIFKNIICEKVTQMGLSFIFFYSLLHLLKFYNVGKDIYSVYICILLYLFIILCILILPDEYPKI
jgi:hypothetical protein